MILNAKTSMLVTLSILLTAFNPAIAQDSVGRGLQQSIRTALDKNPKIRSNDKVLEAMLLRVDSAKMSQLPSLRVGYSASHSSGSISDIGSGVQQPYGVSSRGANISLNWNIYDGGAKRKRIESMECSFKERQANFNSTNTQIRNTQGQIASLVVQFYVALSRSKQNILFTEQVILVLNKFRTAAKTQGEILETENVINNITLDLKEQQATLTSAAGNYKYVVTEDAPADVDSYQQMIESLSIPASPEMAMKIAREKSPEIKSAKYQIECARLRYDSAKASAYSPRVDVSVGRNFGNVTSNIPSGTSSGLSTTSAQISISMNLDAGSSGELNAQKKEIAAAQDNLDGTIADTQHEIQTQYPDLVNAISFAEAYNKNFLASQENIMKYAQDIDAHKQVNVSDALKELGNLMNNYYSYQRYTSVVLNTKFQIQKTVGILFDSLGMKENETRQMSVQ